MQHDTWFGDPEAPSLGFLHVPDGGARGGVVICPPLGYEQVLGYRGLRLLSQQLEQRGIASLRFDYRGEGDASGETAAPDAGERWIATVTDAVRTLRDAGVERIVLAGLAAGGLLAAEAARRIRDSMGVDLEGLVLWDAPLSGHRFLRRQRSLFDLTVGEPATDPERLTLLSLTLHPGAVEWLEGVQLTPLPVDTLALVRRAELTSPAVERFAAELPPGSQLHPIDGHAEWIEAASALAVLPAETIGTIVDWVDARLPHDRVAVRPDIQHEAIVGYAPDGGAIVERLLRVGPERLFVIETARADAHDDRGGVTVLQPGSAEHRVGPGRFQVIAARALAARGTRAIRFDRRGTGDSTLVRIGEPNLIFAEEWIDDVDALVREVVGDAPTAHVGLCSGAWVAARIADRHPTKLTVLLSPTYFKLHGLPAGGYAELAALDQAGRIPFRDLKARIRKHTPGWLWRIAARLQLFHDPETLLGPATRQPGSVVALMLTPEDTDNFAHHRGPGAVARLRRRGADLRVTDYPFGDHSLFGAQVRSAMLRDVLDLTEQAFPVGVPAGRS
ncbi:MAG TPA: alpha/beta hydrolase [Pseudolysinimonas sp.]|nr:alpha/beta hydrolase [Pseudolysinimonas sp.]